MRERQVDVDVDVAVPLILIPNQLVLLITQLLKGVASVTNHSAMLHFNLLALNVFKARAACSKLYF